MGADGTLIDAEDIQKKVASPGSKCLPGDFTGEHRDLGPELYDFRAKGGFFGRGSLQVIVSAVTSSVHVDIDKYNPYEGVVGFLGHALIEWLPYKLGIVRGK